MRRNIFITQSRLRGYMQKYTDNNYILDTCMRVSGQLVGFSSVETRDFYKEDRQFMKRLRKVSNDRIDNVALTMQHPFVGSEVKRIIKSVKEDLRSMA